MKAKQPDGPPMTLSNMTSAEEHRQLATQEAALTKVTVNNESKAQQHAMAPYYTRLADAKEKVAWGQS